MNVETFIKEESMRLKNSRRTIEIAPDINDEHIKTIKKKYGEVLVKNIEKYILVMSFTRTGFFFITGDTFYFNNFMQDGLQVIPFTEVISISAESGGMFTPDRVHFKTVQKEYILDGCIDGISLTTLTLVFNRIIELARNHTNEEFTVSEQGILSSQLPENIKLLYLQILCNYASLNDEIIDADEYNAITKFSVRMELQGNTRGVLRKYMNDFDGRIKTGNLLASIKKITANQTGYWDVVKYCMMQDALYIHEVQKPGKRWEEDGFIGSLMEHCSLNPEQIHTMVTAVSLNKKMQDKDADMEKLKQEWKKLVKSIKDTPGYVPTLYLFCSGSVYGLKSYDGFLKKDETSQKAVNKQRELILQEVIVSNQKAVNVLIGDLNYLAERLEKALVEGDKIQQDYERIKQLLSRIKSAMRTVEQKEECERAITEQ
ncbi:hypothetical protein MR730_09450 [bacterium]|nr:hypothetical protein [bacterium]